MFFVEAQDPIWGFPLGSQKESKPLGSLYFETNPRVETTSLGPPKQSQQKVDTRA